MPELFIPDLQASLGGLAVDSLAESLESMAFISIFPSEGAVAFAPDAVIAEIEFRGPAKGTLAVLTTRALGAALTAALCVPGAAPLEIQPDDALKELMNVVCGSLLRRDGVPPGFDISLPLVHPKIADEQVADFLGSVGNAVLDAEGTPIAIRVRLADAPASVPD